MSNIFTRNLVRFIVLILIQVFLLQNVGYYNLAIPFLYILFILLLPIKIPNWLLFMLSFCSGFVIDIFYDTLGLHAAACTVMALARILFITLTLQQDKYESGQIPSLGNMGLRWFFFYATTLTFIHHTVLFLFEAFRLSDILYTLLRTIASSILTIVLILVYECIFFHRKER
ncbi:MAG: rod shape-determining protein MreD [Sphingobacteriaceae bacterium]|nr:MAG: rod shape-determining protein MreD [Pedobacter sp.]